MTMLLLLALLGLAALAATLRSVRHDGPSRPPRSHATDPSFLPPSERASYDTVV